jgi:hypothetical protein
MSRSRFPSFVSPRPNSRRSPAPSRIRATLSRRPCVQPAPPHWTAFLKPIHRGCRCREAIRQAIRPVAISSTLGAKVHNVGFWLDRSFHGGWPLTARGAERRRQAADPRPVPADAPSIKRSRAGAPETRTLNTASAVIPRRRWSPAAFRAEHARVLSQDRAGDGGEKNRNSAQCFGFGHGFSPYVDREENPLLRRTFRHFQTSARFTSPHWASLLPLAPCGLQCWAQRGERRC